MGFFLSFPTNALDEHCLSLSVRSRLPNIIGLAGCWLAATGLEFWGLAFIGCSKIPNHFLLFDFCAPVYFLRRLRFYLLGSQKRILERDCLVFFIACIA